MSVSRVSEVPPHVVPRGRRPAASSNVAVGAAVGFIALASLLGFASEPLPHAEAAWALRGTIAPDRGVDQVTDRTVDHAPERAAQLPAAPKHV